MRKIFLSFTVLALFLSATLINISASNDLYVYSEDPFEIKNSEAKKKFNSLLKTKEKQKKSNLLDKSKLNDTDLEAQDLSGFEELEKVANGNVDLDFLYTYQNENVTDVIAYDKTDSSYILLEEDKVNNTVSLSINNDTYLLEQDDEKISLLNISGNEIVIYEEIIDPDYPTPLMPADGQEIKNVDGSEPSTYTTWKLLGGPLHKTTKMKFEILELLGMVASGALLYAKTPIGAVVFIYTVAVSIGSSVNPTIHIKYYQYGAADCMSYIREQKYYYGAYSEVSRTWYEQITTKSGTPKITYSYFHSQRPDYTGNAACMRYWIIKNASSQYYLF